MPQKNTWPPSPPDGYEVFQEAPEISPARVRVGILFGVFAAVGVVVAIAWLRRDSVTFESPVLTLGLLPLILVEVVAHEGIHALVARWAGCQTLFRIEWDGVNSAPAVLPYGAFQTRRETMVFYLAPLGAVSVLSLPLLIFGSGIIPTAALVVLFTAFVGSIGDLHDVWFVFQLPEGALEYHNQAGELQYYVPSN